MWQAPSFVYLQMESHYFLICVWAKISWLYFLSLLWSPYSVSLITILVQVSIVGWFLRQSQEAGSVRLHTFLMNSCFHYFSTSSYHINIEWFLSTQHLKRSLLRLWLDCFEFIDQVEKKNSNIIECSNAFFFYCYILR